MRIVLAALTICAAIVVGGCGGDSGGSGSSGQVKPPSKQQALQKLGAGEGQLNIIAWAGYAEDGSTDPKVDWVTPFEQKTGCQVNVKVGNTSDEMVTLMRTGRYDGVSASGDATLRLIAGGDVAPVNTNLVPNYADVYPGLKNQPFNSVDGQMYGIPHGRGANILMWRADKISTPLDSWAAVFDQGSQYKGKVTAYDSPIYIADAALYLKATQPDLGITDVYELTDDQFNAAVDLLKTQRGLIGQYWNDYTKLISASTAGDTVIGTSWQIIANLINADTKNPPVKAIVPKEGSTGWSDTWMVYSKAKNPNCMYLWLDFITRPDIQSQVATWFGEAPANPKACDVIAKSDATFCDTFHATDQAFYDSVAFWKVPLPDCGDSRGATCKGYDAWLQAWQSIKG